MKHIVFIIAMLISSIAFGQDFNIEGEWSPDNQSYLGEIRIKSIGDNKYKVRLNTRDGIRTITSTYSRGELCGSFEDEAPEYGEFWVGNGPIEKGRLPEILVGHERGRYGTNGAVTGWLGDNAGYRKTNSRYNCATVEKSYCKVTLIFKDGNMTAYLQFRSEYLKNGTPIFYQESGKGSGISYSQW